MQRMNEVRGVKSKNLSYLVQLTAVLPTAAENKSARRRIRQAAIDGNGRTGCRRLMGHKENHGPRDMLRGDPRLQQISPAIILFKTLFIKTAGLHAGRPDLRPQARSL